jgi:hypothetical protein
VEQAEGSVHDFQLYKESVGGALNSQRGRRNLGSLGRLVLRDFEK